MGYCTQTDIEREVLTPQLVIQLSDDDGNGHADVGVVSDAIASADATIDSYCGGRYPTPFATVPAIIRSTSAVLAGFRLLARRGFDPDSGDKVMVKRHEEAMTWLRDVAAGRAHVPVSGQTPEPPQQPVRLIARPQTFTHDVLERY